MNSYQVFIVVFASVSTVLNLFLLFQALDGHRRSVFALWASTLALTIMLVLSIVTV